jgi:hypothetical protein
LLLKKINTSKVKTPKMLASRASTNRMKRLLKTISPAVAEVLEATANQKFLTQKNVEHSMLINEY